MKNKIKKNSLYQKLRFSKYWISIFHPKTYRAILQEARFYQKLFHSQEIKGTVFDIGANLGFTVQAFLAAGAERVIAVEPDPYNLEIMKHKFGRNSRVTIIAAAISHRKGKVDLWLHKRDSALHTLEPKWQRAVGNDEYAEGISVQAETLDELIRNFGKPSFIKIDVEGHELMVLRGLSHAIDILSFEVNLPTFREDAKNCIHHLALLYPDARFNYAMDHQWRWKKWHTGETLIMEIKKLDQVCMEIFCINSNN